MLPLYNCVESNWLWMHLSSDDKDGSKVVTWDVMSIEEPKEVALNSVTWNTSLETSELNWDD